MVRAKDTLHFTPLKVNIIFTFTIVYSHAYHPCNCLCCKIHLIAVLQVAGWKKAILRSGCSGIALQRKDPCNQRMRDISDKAALGDQAACSSPNTSLRRVQDTGPDAHASYTRVKVLLHCGLDQRPHGTRYVSYLTFLHIKNINLALTWFYLVLDSFRI